MATVVIDLKQAGAHVEKMGEAIKRAARRGLVQAAMRGVQVIQTEIIPARTPQPVDRGIYKAGWKFAPEPDGASIYNNEPHAVFIEEGVRGSSVKIGSAMIKALSEWALRKGIAGDAKEAKQAAWAIARAMKAKGIFNRGGNGLGVMRELVEQHLPKIVQQEVEREVKKALK